MAFFSDDRTVPAPGLLPARRTTTTALILSLAALGALVFAALASWLALGLPFRLAVLPLAVLLAAITVLAFGFHAARPRMDTWWEGPNALDALMLMLLIGAAINAGAAWLQFVGAASWLPGLPNLSIDGRPGGLLRQPNHLGSVLIWGVIAVGYLRGRRSLTIGAAFALAVLLLSAAAICGSRTALLSAIVVSGWAALDKGIARPLRWMLLCAPVVIALGWFVIANLVTPTAAPQFGASLLARADGTSSRGVLWLQCLEMIKRQPWYGAGLGQFNFAWTLTPTPDLPRSAAYAFSHAHNLFLHLAVEIGVPVTVLVLSLALGSIILALRGALSAGRGQSALSVAAMLAVMLVHSQLEFPLWKLHFLLPACFLLGALCALAPAGRPWPGLRNVRGLLIACGVAMVLAGLVARQQFEAVERVYISDEPNGDAQRIEVAQRSLLFGYLGDRMAGTLRLNGDPDPEAFAEVAFDGLDVNLLQAWSRAAMDSGDLTRGCFLRDRLAEFAMGRQGAAEDPRCVEIPREARAALDYRDFRR